jgi:hypothetical protein
MCDPFGTKKAAERSAQVAAQGARDAASAQEARTREGLDKYLGTYYPEAQNYLTSSRDAAVNYLQPYIDAGSQNATLLNDIIGVNGPDAQTAALGKYQSSPSANLLKQVQDEALRQTAGKWASEGGYKSGSMIQDLSRRQSDIALGDYYNWENLSKGLANMGQGSASQAASITSNTGSNQANLANSAGTNYLSTLSDIGAIQGSGISGAANATAQGITNKANANANLWGTGINMLGSVAGFGMGNDWFGLNSSLKNARV